MNCYYKTVARRYETAHVADSQRSSDPLFKNKRSRTIAKRRRSRFHPIGGRFRKRRVPLCTNTSR